MLRLVVSGMRLGLGCALERVARTVSAVVLDSRGGVWDRGVVGVATDWLGE